MGIPLERTKDVPKCTVGIITWLCEYTKRHWSICYANYILSELIPKPQNEKQQFSVLIFWMPCHLLWRAVWPPLTRINVKLKLRRKKLVIFVPDRTLSLRLGRENDAVNHFLFQLMPLRNYLFGGGGVLWRIQRIQMGPSFYTSCWHHPQNLLLFFLQ